MDDMNGSATDATDVRIYGDVKGLRGRTAPLSDWSPPSIGDLAELPPLSEPPPRPAMAETETARPAAGQSPTTPRTRPVFPPWIEAGSVFEMAWQRPEDAAHLLRSMALEDARDGRPDFHRAALALISLGVEIATEIIGPDTFRHSELRELAHAITDIPQVSVEEQHEHLATFARQLEAREWIRTGGVDFAYRAVRGARGMRMAQYVSEQVADTSRPRFTILNKVPAAQVAPRIASEHPQTIALLLSQLEPEQAGAILAQLSERLQADVAYRIATIDEAAPTAVRDLETVLEDTFRDAVAGKTEGGGTDVTAQILQASTTAVERNVLQQMDAQVPEIAAVLRELGCRREGTDAGDKSGEAT